MSLEDEAREGIRQQEATEEAYQQKLAEEALLYAAQKARTRAEVQEFLGLIERHNVPLVPLYEEVQSSGLYRRCGAGWVIIPTSTGATGGEYPQPVPIPGILVREDGELFTYSNWGLYEEGMSFYGLEGRVEIIDHAYLVQATERVLKLGQSPDRHPSWSLPDVLDYAAITRRIQKRDARRFRKRHWWEGDNYFGV